MSVKNFIVNGGNDLSGVVTVSGSKNETLAILACVLALRAKTIIKNVPKISDVFNFLKIGENINLKYEFKDNDLYIDASNLCKGDLDLKLIGKLRASIYYLPILVGFMDEFIFGIPGGCNLGGRPIDYHLSILKSAGVDYIKYDDHYSFKINELKDFKVFLPFPSFGATINALLLGLVINKKVMINNFAKEVEIRHVISFLSSCGVSIIESDNEINVGNNNKINIPSSYYIHADRIVAATYLSLGVLLGDNLIIKNCPYEDLKDYFNFLDFGDIKYIMDRDKIIISSQSYNEKISLIARPYPGLSTDILPLLVPLIIVGKGVGFIKDRVYKNRLDYLLELTKFNANIRIIEGDAIILGEDNLYPAEVNATDLRGGMASLSLALKIKGRSKIRHADILSRGYENLLSTLISLGADIYEED